MNTFSDRVLVKYSFQLGIGDIERHTVGYDNREGEEAMTLWLKIKNKTSISHLTSYLAGPFMLYFDVRLQDYHHLQSFVPEDEENGNIPTFETALLPQKSKLVKLTVPAGQVRYWVIDTISEILFNKIAKVSVEVSIATSKTLLRGKYLKKCAVLEDMRLNVTHHSTSQLWQEDTPMLTTKPTHLIILTHGIHSNVSTDMLYLKEQIDTHYKSTQQDSPEQIVVKGYTGNVCETERGIKYLGVKLAKYIIGTLYNEQVVKISFVGHSLGGLVQAFALAYISISYPWFFEKVEPMNFITLASPLLGLHSNSPTYVKYVLSNGMIGKVGLDLNLERDIDNDKVPLLYLLSGEPTNTILKRFKKRTIYANGINDGIVPLYSSSLLYVDYNEILSRLAKVQKRVNVSKSVPKPSVISSLASVIFLPRPDSHYINNADERDDSIIHDKLYSPKDIPQIQEKYKDTILRKYFKKDIKTNYDLVKLMADNWHRDMEWRKVIVAMKPDAHNNIIVRRRFGNAYGWSVVDHLVTNHFGSENTPLNITTTADTETIAKESNFSPTTDPNKMYAWLTRAETVYQEGMITNVSGILQKSFRY